MPKEEGGATPHYETRARLQARVDDYFASCWTDGAAQGGAEGGERRQVRPYTVAGLAAHLGFSSRQALAAYEVHAEFRDIVKSARLQIEMDIEERLLAGKNPAAAIFWLKNHADYKDRTELAHAGGVGVQVQIIDKFEVAK